MVGAVDIEEKHMVNYIEAERVKPMPEMEEK
jgi:hypothetical protein